MGHALARGRGGRVVSYGGIAARPHSHAGAGPARVRRGSWSAAGRAGRGAGGRGPGGAARPRNPPTLPLPLPDV